MQGDVIKYIKDNITELKERGRLKPSFITEINKLGVAYTFTDISAGHLSKSQLTLNVISGNYDEIMEMHDRLKELLAMEEDSCFVTSGNTRFRCVLSAGGGQLFNTETQCWEISRYYIIDWRTIK